MQTQTFFILFDVLCQSSNFLLAFLISVFAFLAAATQVLQLVQPQQLYEYKDAFRAYHPRFCALKIIIRNISPSVDA